MFDLYTVKIKKNRTTPKSERIRFPGRII